MRICGARPASPASLAAHMILSWALGMIVMIIQPEKQIHLHLTIWTTALILPSWHRLEITLGTPAQLIRQVSQRMRVQHSGLRFAWTTEKYCHQEIIFYTQMTHARPPGRRVNIQSLWLKYPLRWYEVTAMSPGPSLGKNCFMKTFSSACQGYK